jgi:oxalate decarboxylase/phosphoglucose isomerase-like protein (cupin superfamily)
MEKFGSCAISYEGDVDTLVFDWGKIQFLSDERTTGAKPMSFGSVRLEPGKGHSRHNHPDADEYIYVVSGTGEQMLDDHPAVPIKAGACIWIPIGVYHSTLNTGSDALHLVVVYNPAGPEEGLRTMPDVQIIPHK